MRRLMPVGRWALLRDHQAEPPPHDVVAERWGTVGEIRGELQDGHQVEQHTTLEDWLRS